ncbi:MAG: peptide ABC transporter permease [Erysipelotrichaceae bacterium]|nr:MAG: peptide ABC transporter [Erysipelotrichaceae bacterium]TXT19728.1 MAG: peptide ABC transporter permease [Erysipelotrichaceae bacterium]
MKKYILIRVLRSVLSILAVTSIAYLLIFEFVPRNRVFENDGMYAKISNRPDQLPLYVNSKFEELGYLIYKPQDELCRDVYGANTADYTMCQDTTSSLFKSAKATYEAKGFIFYTIEQTGYIYATKEIPVLERLLGFYSRMIVIDHPNVIQDEGNPNLERKIYIGQNWDKSSYALMCSGCEHKYLVYLDWSFPFVHQNVVSLYFGRSLPTFYGIPTFQVLTQDQGTNVLKPVTFPTGVVTDSGVMEYTCSYKSSLDSLETTKFNDNYANCSLNRNAPSMMGTSFIFGILALIFSYLISIPLGMYMASHKGKAIDKAGMAYIVFVIAVPALAYIYLFRYIGSTLFQLPESFPSLGPNNMLSYIMPTISLALPSVAGLLMWTRRYMVDQNTADYVKFARSKGLSEWQIYLKHILRNAIIPIAHGLPGAIIGAIGGAIITERIYAIPGMGKMLNDSIRVFNNNMVITLTFIFTSLAILSVLLGDLLITRIDPRIILDDKKKGKRKNVKR